MKLLVLWLFRKVKWNPINVSTVSVCPSARGIVARKLNKIYCVMERCENPNVIQPLMLPFINMLNGELFEVFRKIRFRNKTEPSAVR